MSRKVIQISFAAYQGCGIVALCDDGTIWINNKPNKDQESKWDKVLPIPQDTNECCRGLAPYCVCPLDVNPNP